MKKKPYPVTPPAAPPPRPPQSAWRRWTNNIISKREFKLALMTVFMLVVLVGLGLAATFL